MSCDVHVTMCIWRVGLHLLPAAHTHFHMHIQTHMQTHPALQQAAIRPMHYVQVTIIYAIDSRMYFVRRIFDRISTPFEQLYVLIEANCSIPKAPFTKGTCTSYFSQLTTQIVGKPF